MFLFLQASEDEAAMSTPAFQQALYVQKRAQKPASRTESMELAALALLSEPKPGSSAAKQPVTDEKTQQQQVKCTVIRVLLLLCPLVAEEAVPDRAAADVLINELLPSDDLSLRRRTTDELKDTAAELHLLCLRALLTLSVQLQTKTSLFALSEATAGITLAAEHDSELHEQLGHALVFKVDELIQTGYQRKQVLSLSCHMPS